jgi:hypothetical protein
LIKILGIWAGTLAPVGVTSTALINENWMFNEEGKVSYIRQFSAMPQKP